MTDLPAAVEQALASRQGRRTGAEIKFLCPSHDDQNPSAEWNRKKGVWNCPVCGAGGSTANLAGLLGIEVPTLIKRAELGEIVATYDYQDEDGGLRFQKLRYLPKDFRIRHPIGPGQWKWGMGTSRLLYRLPELLSSTGIVWICEGEKDADGLRLHGLTATTWPEGAQDWPRDPNTGKKKMTGPPPKQKWLPQYNGLLKGRDVVILPDNDTGGVMASEWIAAALNGIAASVRIVALPGLPEKGDVSDWLAHGGTIEEMTALAENTPLWAPQAEPAGVAAFPLTDAGNAELFAHLNSHRVRFDHIKKRWLVWARHRWQPDPDGEMYRLAIEAARQRYRESADIENADRATATAKFAKRSENGGMIESMLKLASATEGLADAGLGWDANPYLLGTESGVVNLTTGELRAGKPDDRITMTVGIPYDPKAQCPRWLQFVAEVFDPEVIPFVKRAVGYSLTGSTREQCWFLGYGKGSNGKSVFMDTLYELGGDYSGDTGADTLTSRGRFRDGSQASPDVASLAGRRIITCNETQEVAGFNAERVKHLTDGTPVTARHLNQGQFTFRPVLKLWLTTNHLPKVDDDSEGFWRRPRLIPFTRTFEGPDRDPNLEEKLRLELPGILAWAVEGAVEWHRDGLNPPATVMMATHNYRQSSDPLAEFISDCCYVGDARVTQGPLYEAYKAWGKDQGYSDREVLGARLFGRRMEDRFGPRVKSMNGRWFVGVGLRSAENPARFVPIGTEPHLAPPESQSKASAIWPRVGATENLVPIVPTVPTSICDCEERHPGDDDCGDLPWWENADGWHCPSHHPNPMTT